MNNQMYTMYKEFDKNINNISGTIGMPKTPMSSNDISAPDFSKMTDQQLQDYIKNLSNMNFDLNIHNYTKNELIEMFGLPDLYDKNIVEIKESKLRDSIINNKQINKE